VVALSARAADDVLELFDTLMTTELLSKAERESANEKLRRYPRVSRNAGKLAAAVKVLLALEELDPDAGLAAAWELIENEVPKHELRAQGYPVLAEDVPRLSPFVRHHISIDGHYSFHLPDLGGSHRPLCDPDAEDDAWGLPLAGRDRPLHWAISQTSHIRPIFSPVLRGPHLDIEGVPDPNTSPGSTRPIRPDERPGVSGFTAQKSSATSSVLVAPRHPRKD
jgi:hypothetical protein